MANSSIDRPTPNTLIQPKVCLDGRYPSDLSTPVTLTELMRFSESRLDRLLEEYEISFHGISGYDGRDPDFDVASRGSLVLKLSSLLDFLGARQLADALRSRDGSRMSGSRGLLNAAAR